MPPAPVDFTRDLHARREDFAPRQRYIGRGGDAAPQLGILAVRDSTRIKAALVGLAQHLATRRQAILRNWQHSVELDPEAGSTFRVIFPRAYHRPARRG